MTNEELALAIKNGDQGLIETLWNQCYLYICKQAKRWVYAWIGRRDFEKEDLIQSGFLALSNAIGLFVPDSGSFLTVLKFCLQTEFQKVAGCRTTKRDPINDAESLDAPIGRQDGEPSNLCLADIIADPNDDMEDMEDEIFQEQLAVIVRRAISSLAARQRTAVDLHYLQGMPYKQIGLLESVSSSYVGMICKEGLKALKQGQYAADLCELLYGERNYYRHTGFAAFKYSGSSSPEWELLDLENKTQRIKSLFEGLNGQITDK